MNFLFLIMKVLVLPMQFVLLLLLPIHVSAKVLTEGISLQIGLNQPDIIRLLDSRTNLAKGNLLSSQTWLNPVANLSLEELNKETTINLWLEQSVDFSGQRRFNSDAAKVAVEIAEANNQQQLSLLKAEISNNFYQLLFQQHQQQLLQYWIDKFARVENSMRQREIAGDVSGYDRLRISRERIVLLAQQRQAEVQYAANWQELLAVIGQQDIQQFNSLAGELLPATLSDQFDSAPKIIVPPKLLQQQLNLKASQLSDGAVARSHIPAVTFGIGIKNLTTPTKDYSGLMLSLTVDLPLFDQQQGARQQSSALVAQLASEYQLAKQQHQLRVVALRNKTNQLRVNALLFKQQSMASSVELLAIAETSYQMNELGVLELIDAYNNALETEVSALQLALEARLSLIQLNKITGVY